MDSPQVIFENLRQRASERADGNESVEETIGKLTHDFRVALGLTPTQFAKELKASVQSVHRWEATGKLPIHRLTDFSTLIKQELRETISPQHRENGDELAGKLLQAAELLRPRLENNREAIRLILEVSTALLQERSKSQ